MSASEEIKCDRCERVCPCGHTQVNEMVFCLRCAAEFLSWWLAGRKSIPRHWSVTQ